MNAHQILFVEDDPIISMSASEFIRDRGFKVLDADCALDAMKVIDRHSYLSALVTDIGSSVSHGAVVAREYGLPCVVTPAVHEGLPAEVVPATRLAATPAEFAAAIVDLLGRTPQERRAIAGRAALQRLAWPDRLAPLLPLLESPRSQVTNRAIPSVNGVDGR